MRKTFFFLLGLAACSRTETASSRASLEFPTKTKFCGCQVDPKPPFALPAPTAWVDARALGPAWGYYDPEGSFPVRKSDAERFMTWVLSLPPPTSPRHVYALTHAGFERHARGRIDEQALEVTTAPGPLPAGWAHLGMVPSAIAAGPHHLEVSVGQGRPLVAVLVSTDSTPAFPVPAPDGGFESDGGRVFIPQTRATRTYRLPEDGGSRWILGPNPRFDEDFTDWYPFDGGASLTLRGARNEVVATAMSFVFTTPHDLVHATTTPFTNGSFTIPSERIDLRVAIVRPETSGLFSTRERSLARLLVKDDVSCGTVGLLDDCPLVPVGHQGRRDVFQPVRTSVSKSAPRVLWLTVDLGGVSIDGHESPVPAGTYTGTIELSAEYEPTEHVSVPVSIVVDELLLPPAPGWNGVIYNRCVHDGELSHCTELAAMVDAGVLRRERIDQLAHGLTSTFNANDFPGLGRSIEAGFSGPAHRKAFVAADRGLVREPWGLGATDFDEARRWYEDAGWEVVRFVCDEPPEPDSTLNSRASCGAKRDLDGGYPLTNADVFDNLMRIGLEDRDAGRPATITLNKPSTLPLAQVFDRAILSITTTGLWDARVELSTPPSRGYTAYWVSSLSYPVAHRGLAGRFTRTMHGGVDGGPVTEPLFRGITVNSYDQGYPHGYTVPDRETSAPIPTAAWEALREGLDDMRYREALESELERLGNRKCTNELAAKAVANALAELETREWRLDASTHSFTYFQYLTNGATTHEPGSARSSLDDVRDTYRELLLRLRAVSCTP